MKQLMIAVLALAPACAIDTSTSTTSDDLESIGGAGQSEPAGAMVHWARGEGKPTGNATASNLAYHGGPVLTAGTFVRPIFWGQNWNNSTFVGDKISGLQSFYVGLGGSNYAPTNSEYTQSNGVHVSTAVTLGATIIDLSTAAKSGQRTSTILAEVCKMVPNPVAGGYYPVYVDAPRGSAGYCAWHSSGTCNGVLVQFAFFFNLDGDSGCDPGATGGHSQGLSALANVTGHEWSEMVTDPQLNAWYDSSGSENADKCAWTFGANLIPFPNGIPNPLWRIQGNWSNNASNAGVGYGGHIGCIDGTN
jgi:hypothetical protein